MVALGPEPTMLPYPGRSPPKRRKVPSSSAWISYSPQSGAAAFMASVCARTLISVALRSSAISAGLFFARRRRTVLSSERVSSQGWASLSVARNRAPRVSESFSA
jgi:hypothetical protein